MYRTLTAIIQSDEDASVASCPEVDITSQGETEETARENLRKALELFFECAPAEELERRMANRVVVASVAVAVG